MFCTRYVSSFSTTSQSVHSSQCKACEGSQKDKLGKNTKLVLGDLV